MPCHAQNVDLHPSSMPGPLACGPALSPPGPDHAWLKATASGEGNCLEVRRLLDRVQVRNSTSPQVLVEFTEHAWVDLVEAAKTGALDLDVMPESWPT